MTHAPEASAPSATARRIAFWIYVPAALAWIVGTDLAVATWTGTLDTVAWVNMAKGGLFVLVTGFLLYLLILREIRRRDAAERDRRTLTENVPDLIFRMQVRPDLRFEYVSPAAVEIAGYTPEEHYADPGTVLGAVHPDDRSRLRRLLDDLDSGESSAELRWKHKDGPTRWTEIRVSKERGPDGRVVRMAGVVRDITDRRAGERRRRLVESALEAAGEMVMVTDREGTIEYVNPAFTAITGYAPEDAIGANPRILGSGQQDAAFYRDLWGTITSGRTFRGVLVNRRADGRLYDQATSITPVYGDGGEVEHFVAVARDITVQRELERRLRHTEKMDAVGQLAAGVAHDFRNLLSVILVNTELVASGEAEEEDGGVQRAVEEIEEAARRGTELVTRLLKLSRQPDVRLRLTDLTQLVGEMEPTLRALVPGSVELRVRTPGAPCVTHVDPSLLQDAIINLVVNAGQATPPGGRIVVGVDTPEGSAAAGGWPRIVVRDSGSGMDEATAARVFDPFFTTKESGTGLGLPMVKSAVERFGGRIELRSRRGYGTTVALAFPPEGGATTASRPEDDEPVGEQTPDPAAAARPASGAASGARVLLVEDEEALRRAAERVLVRLGYEVAAVENGRLAFSRLEEAPTGWDLVISDLVMPELGGLELYEMVRERGWEIPFLFMSGDTPGGADAAPNPDRGHVFLEKPWTVQLFSKRVEEILAESRRIA